MNNKTKAIVIQKMDYKEQDELVKMLTLDYGLLTFVAKSSKKMNSKKSSSLNPYMELMIEFDYLETKDLFTLKNVSTVENFYFDFNFDGLVLSQLVLEVASYLLQDNENFQQYYHLLIDYFRFLKHDSFLATCYFLAQSLEIEGIKPSVEHCAYCGQSSVIAIESSSGFVCRQHSSQADFYDIDSLKKFRYINLVKYHQLEQLIPLSYRLTDLKILLKFMSQYLDRTIKSFSMLEEIKNY